MEVIVLLVITAPISMLIGLVIGRSKGRAAGGAMLGLLIGPLGWLLVACGDDLRKKCTACRMPIDPEATICPHCRTPTIEKSTAEPLSETIADPVPLRGDFEYWYADQNEVEGPVRLAQLVDWMEDGQLVPETKVQRVGGNGWVKLRDLLEHDV
jgi:hypothetical protein